MGNQRQVRRQVPSRGDSPAKPRRRAPELVRLVRPLARRGESPCPDCDVRGVAFCNVLAPAEFVELEAIRTTIEMHPRETIFHQGDRATHFFTLTAGTVRIVRLLLDGRRQITGFPREGEFLGLTREVRYAYTAEAITPTVLCRFPRAGLERLLKRYPTLDKRLLGMALTEIAAAHDQVLLLGRKTARERVATLLLMLSRGAARRGRPENPIELPMSREDIADYLGLTLETVSRTFNSLRREGYIDFAKRGRATFLRIERLKALSGD